MEENSPRRSGDGWYLLVAGGGFLAVACLSIVLGIAGVLDRHGVTELAMSFGAVGAFNLLLVPMVKRMARFETIPSGQKKDAWVEGTAVHAPGNRGGILVLGDRVRLGVSQEGLHVRRTLKASVAFGAIYLAGIVLMAVIEALTDNIHSFGEIRAYIAGIVGLPLLLGFALLLAFDPPSNRHSVIHPWPNVARIVETKEALFIHFKDDSGPLVASFPRYQLRRILPRLAGHAAVEEYVRTTVPAPLGTPGPIDARAQWTLERELENLRRLQE